MTVELTFLALTALLAATLWLPFVIGVNTAAVALPDDNRPLDPARYPPWVHRAYRAHLNLLEQFLPFAVIVVIAHLAGVSGPVTSWAAGVFFVLRVAHAYWMISGRTVLPVRPILFTAGWVCILVIGVTALVSG
ncbi:MAG: MAPEG family protein [Pseudomonadota bacterium]